MDRSTPVAASGAVPEAGNDAVGSFGRHPELLPDQGSSRGSGGGKRKPQGVAAPRPRLREPPLSSTEGSTDGGPQDRIPRSQESSVKCGSRRIPAQSRFSFVAELATGGFTVELPVDLNTVAVH